MDSIGKFFVSLSLVASLSVVSGCDFLRTLASRPTSADIQAKREKIAICNERVKAAQDSVKAVRDARIKDSLLLQECLNSGLARTSEKVGSILKDSLRFRCYIIVGAFRSKQNADNLMKKLDEAGYCSEALLFRSGLTAVGACPSNSISESCSKLASLQKESFCPADVWIYVKD